MAETLERYKKQSKEFHHAAPNPLLQERNPQRLEVEVANMVKKIEQLEASKRRLLGEGLAASTIEELQQTERQLERSLRSVRARKTQLYKQHIAQLKEKGKTLAAENALLLSEKSEGEKISDVETDLFIGLPRGHNNMNGEKK
ncbi:hypothetical protein M569_16254 [Genlisea aurea]|uniref:K-box domain-containing protein n=1 Tax=Genlisea aurea TaxID=192259 RepID=S8BW15_9LAMI|nr:hypothetical protein M569_16254 [Genlisea aurea]